MKSEANQFDIVEKNKNMWHEMTYFGMYGCWYDLSVFLQWFPLRSSAAKGSVIIRSVFSAWQLHFVQLISFAAVYQQKCILIYMYINIYLYIYIYNCIKMSRYVRSYMYIIHLQYIHISYPTVLLTIPPNFDRHKKNVVSTLRADWPSRDPTFKPKTL